MDVNYSDTDLYVRRFIKYMGNLISGYIVTPVTEDCRHNIQNIKPQFANDFGLVFPLVKFSSFKAANKTIHLNTTPNKIVRHNESFDYKSCIMDSLEYAKNIVETVAEVNPVFSIAEGTVSFIKNVTAWKSDYSESEYENLDPWYDEYKYTINHYMSYDLDRCIKNQNRKNYSEDLLTWKNKNYSTNDHLFQIEIEYNIKYVETVRVPDFSHGFQMVDRKYNVDATNSSMNFDFSCGISYKTNDVTSCYIFGYDSAKKVNNSSEIGQEELKKMCLSKSLSAGIAINYSTTPVKANL